MNFYSRKPFKQMDMNRRYFPLIELRITLLILGFFVLTGCNKVDTPEEIFQKGITCFKQKNYVLAVKYFKEIAEQGHAGAQAQLGICYTEGLGVKSDSSEAVKWYRASAEQGNATAQYKLGMCYLVGYGVKEDWTDAAKWFRKAAEQGHADAKARLRGFEN